MLDQQPLQIGLGLLPDWLPNKRAVISLDTYNDNLCFFRCLAVYRGARRLANTRKTQELARSFFTAYNIPSNNLTLKHFHLLERHFKQGIAAYTVLDNDDNIGFPLITVGIHGSHAFLITDINKVTNNDTCGECSARFTRADNLTRHAKT